MPDENFVQGENFCFPPNYLFTLFLRLLLYLISFLSGKNGVFRVWTCCKPLPSVCPVSWLGIFTVASPGFGVKRGTQWQNEGVGLPYAPVQLARSGGALQAPPAGTRVKKFNTVYDAAVL